MGLVVYAKTKGYVLFRKLGIGEEKENIFGDIMETMGLRLHLSLINIKDKFSYEHLKKMSDSFIRQFKSGPDLEKVRDMINDDLYPILVDLVDAHNYNSVARNFPTGSLLEEGFINPLDSECVDYFRGVYKPGGHEDIVHYKKLSLELQTEIKDLYDGICKVIYPGDIFEFFNHDHGRCEKLAGRTELIRFINSSLHF